MNDRPAIIAVGDQLESIQGTVAGDAATAVADARAELREFDAREATHNASMLDDAENLLLRAQEQVSGEPARRIEAVRNRLRIYRETVARSDDGLAVIDSHLRTESEGEASVDILRGETAQLVATVVNGGEDRRVLVDVGFYADDGTELEEVASEPVSIGANEEVAIDLEVVVPEGADYYGTAALDADAGTVG